MTEETRQSHLQGQTPISSVAIIGLGYVGLPLAVAFAEAGLMVIGFDLNSDRVATISAGSSPGEDVASSRVRQLLNVGKLKITYDERALSAADAIVICVPTPLRATRDPDLSMIDDTAKRVGRLLQRGQLVVLESTTYSGTTEEILLAELSTSGLVVGKDFFVGYSPERLDPGSTNSNGYTLRNTPKVVAGITEACLERAVTLYSMIIDQVVTVSSPRIAEMAKLYENAFRVVNVAMANEMALLCDRMGLDVWEVLDAAGTKPYGYMKFLPGPGVGGHCIPVDPFYLTWKAKEYGFNTRFIELAGEINLAMPHHVFHLVERALNMKKQSVHGANVMLLGIAYKPDISDTRESPALKILELLQHAGANVTYHDPHVPMVSIRTSHQSNVTEQHSSPLTPSTLEATDCVVLVTDHSALDLSLVLDHANLLVDTRNATGNLPSRGACVVRL